tara:strand:+ start:196 stop:387 length:192 start_codon:yes stop_codon:yes gene_type:complete
MTDLQIVLQSLNAAYTVNPNQYDKVLVARLYTMATNMGAKLSPRDYMNPNIKMDRKWSNNPHR